VRRRMRVMSSASTPSNEKALIQADTHQSCDVRVYEEEDEEEDACPVTMWFAWHMHTHQEEEEEEIEQTPEEQALFEAAEEV
jgi:hypothetical protein